MAYKNLETRLKELVLSLSDDPKEFEAYSKNPKAYLAKKKFSKTVIAAIVGGKVTALQEMMSRAKGGPVPVFCIIGVKGFRP